MLDLVRFEDKSGDNVLILPVGKEINGITYSDGVSTIVYDKKSYRISLHPDTLIKALSPKESDPSFIKRLKEAVGETISSYSIISPNIAVIDVLQLITPVFIETTWDHRGYYGDALFLVYATVIWKKGAKYEVTDIHCDRILSSPEAKFTTDFSSDTLKSQNRNKGEGVFVEGEFSLSTFSTPFRHNKELSRYGFYSHSFDGTLISKQMVKSKTSNYKYDVQIANSKRQARSRIDSAHIIGNNIFNGLKEVADALVYIGDGMR